MHCTAAICPSPHVVSYLCIDASISRISHRSGGDIGGGNQEIIGVESSEGLGARAYGTSYARHGVARATFSYLVRRELRVLSPCTVNLGCNGSKRPHLHTRHTNCGETICDRKWAVLTLWSLCSPARRRISLAIATQRACCSVCLLDASRAEMAGKVPNGWEGACLAIKSLERMQSRRTANSARCHGRPIIHVIFRCYACFPPPV